MKQQLWLFIFVLSISNLYASENNLLKQVLSAETNLNLTDSSPLSSTKSNFQWEDDQGLLLSSSDCTLSIGACAYSESYNKDKLLYLAHNNQMRQTNKVFQVDPFFAEIRRKRQLAMDALLMGPSPSDSEQNAIEHNRYLEKHQELAERKAQLSAQIAAFSRGNFSDKVPFPEKNKGNKKTWINFFGYYPSRKKIYIEENDFTK